MPSMNLNIFVYKFLVRIHLVFTQDNSQFKMFYLTTVCKCYGRMTIEILTNNKNERLLRGIIDL